MDSTSIVSMSDHARRLNDPDAALIDTISFYDDSEPTWNERPYVSAVEAKRGKTGIHMETSSLDRTFDPVDSSQGVYRLPGADSSAIAWEQKLRDRLDGHGYRIIFSGVGGDEVLGGVPTAFPELADYMVSGNLASLLKRTVAWCLVDRRPLITCFSIRQTTRRTFIDNHKLPRRTFRDGSNHVCGATVESLSDHLTFEGLGALGYLPVLSTMD